VDNLNSLMRLFRLTLILQEPYQRVKMVRHDGKFIQFNQKEFRGQDPGILDDAPQIIQPDTLICAFTQQRFVALNIYRNEISTRGGIIEAGQANGLTGLILWHV